MKKRLTVLLENAVKDCAARGLIPAGELPPVEVDVTRDSAYGDYASNVAMVMASRVRGNPCKVAEIISRHVCDHDNIIEKMEIAGPGFLNFFIREGAWVAMLEAVDNLGDSYAAPSLGKGKKVLVEFVSANPTGPLHIGHARGAVVGDVIANLLTVSGFSVYREYYINDAGNQMNNLGKSVNFRYRELLGEKIEFPEDCYQGDYIKQIAAEILKKDGDTYLAGEEEEVLRLFTGYAADVIMREIREDLRVFGVIFNSYFSERELYKENVVAGLLAELEEKGFIYREGETRWFKTTAFGDEKDRVVIRRNGEPTYFAADIAYHQNKYSRGFDTLIDIWGADHHGYIPRMYAGIQALGREKDSLRIVLVQLVNLMREGKPVAMSTRAGEFVTMKEVVDEVGRDAARYNFLMRRSDSHLDFDLELAKKQSNENPVYYVQYAHARICSILRRAGEQGYKIPGYKEADLHLLKLPEEVKLIKTVTRFPEVVEGAAASIEPHRLTFYLNELAAVFHSYYNKNRVLSEDDGLSGARLFLVATVHLELRNALKLLGISAPEEM
ncbi:MAG: arginine--tRNA ligase [Syntrophales bacterium]|nr:arginine--tRNA ligase [Syntrophales bacterium]